MDKNNDDLLLLTMNALEWLMTVDFASKNHEERMILIKAAKILYPSDEDEES